VSAAHPLQRRKYTVPGAAFDSEVVRISGNENPMGPSKEGLASISKVAPLASRYGPQGDNIEFHALLASTESVPQDFVLSYSGFGTPLANLMPAFTSPTRSWTMATPGYGSGGKGIGNKLSRFLCARIMRTMWKR
jgi:histidinol-phosphate/aromatic aminotransferase/cobyric acid decarboxylase-like protein